jgi:hypothetical protein
MTIPFGGQVVISELDTGGAKALVNTEHGYLVRIEAAAHSYESGYFILSEYLDELGYDDEGCRIVEGNPNG